MRWMLLRRRPGLESQQTLPKLVRSVFAKRVRTCKGREKNARGGRKRGTRRISRSRETGATTSSVREEPEPLLAGYRIGEVASLRRSDEISRLARDARASAPLARGGRGEGRGGRGEGACRFAPILATSLIFHPLIQRAAGSPYAPTPRPRHSHARARARVRARTRAFSPLLSFSRLLRRNTSSRIRTRATCARRYCTC